MKEKLKRQNGITLIALVITIIVLLILAGVTIATLTGDNGILTQAQNAKENTKEAESEEEIALIANEWAIERHTSSKSLGEFLDEKVEKGKIDSVNKNADGTYTIGKDDSKATMDSNGEIIPPFNAEEWDKTAATEDCFIWGSDTKGEEGYDIIVGYTSKLEGYTKLKIPSRCKKIDLWASYTNVSDNTSRSFCSAVKTIELPETVTEIGNQAFASSDWISGFDALESIIIPNSVTRIGNQAFMLCYNIRSITIPNSVTNTGYNIFNSWTSSQIINIQGYSSVPEGWDSYWNGGQAQVNWNQ